jgi:hypothetical protein
MIFFKEKTMEVLIEPGHNIDPADIDITIKYLESIIRLASSKTICWPFLETAIRPRGKVTGSLTMTKKELEKLKDLVKCSGSTIQIRSFKEE